jgi:hypothetical protein
MLFAGFILPLTAFIERIQFLGDFLFLSSFEMVFTDAYFAH